MPIPFIASLVPSLVSALGSIGGGYISRAQSRADIAAQNQYNSPGQMAIRLREAGLPLAAAGGNITGNQSALPETTGKSVEASGQALSGFFATQLQIKQMDLIEKQMGELDEKIESLNIENQRGQEDLKFELDGGFTDSNGIARSNRYLAAERNFKMQNIQHGLLINKKTIDDLDTSMRRALYETGQIRENTLAEFRKTVLGNKLLGLNIRTMEDMRDAENVIMNYMREGGLSLFESLMIYAARTLRGSAAMGSFQMNYGQ